MFSIKDYFHKIFPSIMHTSVAQWSCVRR